MAKHTFKPKKLGRPPNIYTNDQLEFIDKMALVQARDYTIAEAMGMEAKEFSRHFAKRTRQKRAEGKLAIHENQYEMAKKQPVMAIWLGKQHLEQSDKAQVGGDVTFTVVNYAGSGSTIKKKRLPTPPMA